MDVSKLWGRHRQSNPTSPQQFYRAVLLANDLVSKVLSIRESELDEEVGGIELQSIQRDKNKPRFNSERKLTTELLAQTVALGFAPFFRTYSSSIELSKLLAVRDHQTSIMRHLVVANKRIPLQAQYSE